jgi:hypothetical protein
MIYADLDVALQDLWRVVEDGAVELVLDRTLVDEMFSSEQQLTLLKDGRLAMKSDVYVLRRVGKA